MTLALRYAVRSDRGLIRGNNEDSVYAGPRLLAIADGMGGHAGGEVASKIAIAAFEPLDEDTPSGDLLAALRRATDDASAHVREVVNDDPALEGMGTTLTALLFAGRRLAVCHVGDSRCYLMREGQLAQITHDDTFVQSLVDEGRITEEEAHVHPQRSLILRAINGTEVEPDLSIRETRVADRYLLCSDGLSDVVSLETMQEALELTHPQQAADRLVELALRGGGPDNVTCIVADVVNDGGGGTASFDPLVDGAAGDNIGQRDVSASSAAGRAALAGPRPDPDPPAPRPDPPARRSPVKPLLAVLLVVLVLGGGVFALWRVSQNQYYVGAAGGNVAVFRGMDVDVAGLTLSAVQRTSNLQVDDLTPVARGQVRAGITADDPDDADRIIESLRRQLLRPCPFITHSPPLSSTAATTSATGTATAVPGPSTATGAPAPPPAIPSTSTAPSTSTSAAGSTAASSTLIPGVDCREFGTD